MLSVQQTMMALMALEAPPRQGGEMGGGKALTSLTTFPGELVHRLSGSKRPSHADRVLKEQGVLSPIPQLTGTSAHVNSLTTIWAIEGPR